MVFEYRVTWSELIFFLLTSFMDASKKIVRVIKYGCPKAGGDGDDEDDDLLELKRQVDAEQAKIQQARREIALSKSKLESAKAIEGALSKNVVEKRSPVVRLVHVAEPEWWKGPPLLDPWRNVDSPRWPKGFKYNDSNNEGTIFVSLVSYRDPKCGSTLVELFKKALNPEKVNVGVVQQNLEGDKDCFEEYCRLADQRCRRDNVRMIRMKAEESRGVMVVRHLASTMYSGEKYFFQIDAHNLFSNNWDMGLIGDLNKVTNNERVVLSHHPPAAEQFTGWRSNSAINICKYEWDINGLPRFSAQVVTVSEQKPFPGVFIGAGMVFARAELLIDCPFDHHLPYLFSGEELLLAACAFSHGWDIYNPSFTPAFHFYKDPRKLKITNPQNPLVHKKSLKRLKYALGVAGSVRSLPKGEFRADFDKYGMGSARRLDKYYEYAGIDWKKKDHNYPFCNMRRTMKDNVFHATKVEGLPALNRLSFAKGLSRKDKRFEIVTGEDL